MTVKEIDGMPVLKAGREFVFESSFGRRYKLTMADTFTAKREHEMANWYVDFARMYGEYLATWHECTHDEAMAALEAGNETQAFSAAGIWDSVCMKNETVFWGANPNNAHSPVATKPGRQWRVKR